MRQCLSCNATFDDALAACAACGGQRSFVLAGSQASAGGGGSGGGGSPWAQVMAAEWTPNGVVWCGIGMLAVEIPAVLQLVSTKSHEESSFILGAAVVLNLGFAVPVLFQQEWSFWLARLTMAFEIVRHLRAFLIAAAFSGLTVGAIGGLVSATALVACQVLLHLGYSHPSARFWVRFLAPVLVVNLVTALMAIGAGPTGPDHSHRPADPRLATMAMAQVAGDPLRISDSLLCVSWSPPGDWVLDRVAIGARAHPPELDDNQAVTITADFTDAEFPDTVDRVVGLNQRANATVAGPTTFTTASGVVGKTFTVTAGSGRAVVFLFPGHGRSYYLMTCEADPAVGSAHDKDFAKLAASFRLEAGEPSEDRHSQNNSPFDLIPNGIK